MGLNSSLSLTPGPVPPQARPRALLSPGCVEAAAVELTDWLPRNQEETLRGPLLSLSFPVHQNKVTVTQAQFGKNLDLIPRGTLTPATSLRSSCDFGGDTTCPVLPKICFSSRWLYPCPSLTVSKRSWKERRTRKQVLLQVTKS